MRSVLKWVLVAQESGLPRYFAGTTEEGEVVLKANPLHAVFFESREEADFGLFILGEWSFLSPEEFLTFIPNDHAR